MSNGSPLPFRFGIVVTGESIFGRDLSFDECRSALEGMNFLHVVIRLTMLLRINDEKIMSDQVDEPERDLAIANMLGRFLDRGALSEKALDEWAQVRAQGQSFRPFSSQAILALLELAGAHCPRTGGGNVEADPLRLLLTHVLLSIQTELLSRAGRTLLTPGTPMASASEILHPELVRNRMAHNPGWYSRNAMARIYAIGFVPAIAQGLRPGYSPESFFRNRLGLEPGQYLVAAILTGTFHGQFNADAPSFFDAAVRPAELLANFQPSLRGRMEEFLSLASQPSESLGGGLAGITSLSDVIYRATSFYVRPIITFDGFFVCTSSVHLENKFLVGLVHLALDISRTANGGALPTNFVKTLGGEFGELFEAYLRWLFTQWFGTWPRTRLHFSYRIPASGTGLNDPERDILIVRGDTAYVFEVKSKPVPLGLRHAGTHERLDDVYLPGALQARSAAEALRAGTATTRDGTPITGIRYVIPCVICWDFIPMAGALSQAYESHLTSVVGPATFQEVDGIAPLQFLSLEDVEGWERNCDLTPESGDLFGFLLRRAREAELRYAPIQSNHFRGPQVGQPRPLEDMATLSKQYVDQETWNYITAGRPPGSPGTAS